MALRPITPPPTRRLRVPVNLISRWQITKPLRTHLSTNMTTLHIASQPSSTATSIPKSCIRTLRQQQASIITPLAWQHTSMTSKQPWRRNESCRKRLSIQDDIEEVKRPIEQGNLLHDILQDTGLKQGLETVRPKHGRSTPSWVSRRIQLRRLIFDVCSSQPGQPNVFVRHPDRPTAAHFGLLSRTRATSLCAFDIHSKASSVPTIRLK